MIPGELGQLFGGDPREIARLDEAENWIREHYRDSLQVYRATARIVDVHAAGVAKIRTARELQRSLGKKYLVCVGDGENDRNLLAGADYGFCPADGAIREDFPNVCPCGEGAVADVIEKCIPAILSR